MCSSTAGGVSGPSGGWPSTEENLERLFDLVREVKRQIRPLERQAAAARSYAGLADELRAVRAVRGRYRARAPSTSATPRAPRLRRAARRRGGQAPSSLGRARRRHRADRRRAVGPARVRPGLRPRSGRGDGRAGPRAGRRAPGAAALPGPGPRRRGRRRRGVHPRGRGRPAGRGARGRRGRGGGARARARRARRGRERRRPGARGPSGRPGATAASCRRADEAVTVARGQLASLEHALERDRRALDQLAARLAAAERRSPLLEGEEHELGERLAETEQARHRLQAAVAETEAAHRRATRRLEAAEEALRQAEQEQPPLGGPGRRARAGARRGPGGGRRRAAGRGRRGGRDPARPGRGRPGLGGGLRGRRRGARSPRWSSRAASRPGRRCPGSARAAPPARCSRSPTRSPPAGAGLAEAGCRPGPSRSAPMCARAPGARIYPGLGRGARHAAGRLVLCPQRLVRGHRPGPRPPRSGRGDPRRRPVLVDRAGGSGPAAGWSPPPWSTRPGPGPRWPRRTAAAAAEERGAGARPRSRPPGRLPPRRSGPTTATRSPTRRPGPAASGWRTTGPRWPPSSRSSDAAGPSSTTGSAGTRPGSPSWSTRSCPRLEAAQRSPRPSAVAAAGDERQRIDERIAEAASAARRVGGAVGRAGRAPAGAGRAAGARSSGGSPVTPTSAAWPPSAGRRLEADATAVERLLAVVALGRRSQLDAPLADLRDRHRRQLEAVRAGGARLEELRRRRSADEHELAAVRGRLQKIELDLVEATIRRESVVETLRRELGCGPEEAIGAPGAGAARGRRPGDPGRRSSKPSWPPWARSTRSPSKSCPSSASGTSSSSRQVEDVRAARRELHQVIRTLDDEIMHVFDAAFADVNEHFSNLVTSLFPGGTGPALAHRPGEPARHRRRGRGPPGRPQRPPPVAALGRRAVAGGHGLPLRRVPEPPVALLPDGRGRGGPRRRQPAALPRAWSTSSGTRPS